MGEIEVIWEEMPTNLLRRWKAKYTIEGGHLCDAIAMAEKDKDHQWADELQHRLWRLNNQLAKISAVLVEREHIQTSMAEEGEALH